MPDIGNIGSTSGYSGVGPVSRPAVDPAQRGSGAEQVQAPALPARSDSRDRVELSEHARWLDALRALPAIRADKVAQIKAAIANGTYETDDKLNVAIDRLLSDIKES